MPLLLPPLTPKHATAINDVSISNLRRINSIRWIIVVIQLCGLYLAEYALNISLPWPWIGGIILCFTGAIIYTTVRCRWATPVTVREFELYLAVDVSMQTALLYQTGGCTNPFIFVNLITVIIAAALLPRRNSWHIAALSIACYSLLMVQYQPLAMGDAEGMSGKNYPGHDVNIGLSPVALLHLSGMWLTFSVSACLVTGVITQMAASLREHRAAISASREQQLRNERIISVALTAAGAAHELATPLSTMSVVLQDMERFHTDTQLWQDIYLLQSQVKVCRNRLERIIDSSLDQDSKILASSKFITQVLDEWQLLRPCVDCHSDSPDRLNSFIEVGPPLVMALINLLNNAADASGESQRIQITLSETESQLILSILDQGKGILPEIAEKLGYSIVSGKKNGFGLGLQLSMATIEHFSGVVSLKAAPEGGTLTEIILPVVDNREQMEQVDVATKNFAGG